MTDPGTERREAATGHGGVRSEEDRVSSLKIIAVGVGSLIVFFLASFVTLSYLHRREGERPLLPVPPEIGQSKIGLVEQQLFESATRGERDREVRRKQLGSYGWVDRKAGVVRIPIERAMELSAHGVRPRPNAPGGASPEGQP
jgi:hypothetical protein